MKWIVTSVTERGYIPDTAEGDAKGGIPPSISFKNLPGHGVCPEFGAEKEGFYKNPGFAGK